VTGIFDEPSKILYFKLVDFKTNDPKFYLGEVKYDGNQMIIDGMYRNKKEKYSFEMYADIDHLKLEHDKDISKGHICWCPTSKGFFEEDFRCLECPDSCYQCYGQKYNNCTTCKPLANYPGAIKVELNEGRCELECENGFY